MDETWLNHRLTPDEADTFRERGYLLVDDALPLERRKSLVEAIDRCYARLRQSYDIDPSDRVLLLDLLGLEHEFLDLVDLRATFPKVWDILGWNIQIYHTTLSIVPPSPTSDALTREHYIHSHNPRLTKSGTAEPAWMAWKWHRDSGQVNVDLGPGVQPRLSVKVAYLLTDALEETDGNLYVIPGSHLSDQREPVPGPGRIHDGAVAVRAPAGSAVIFDRRIVHSSSPNTGGTTRKALFYGYSHRWFRPRDDQTVGSAIKEAPPIRRQLLGAGLGGYGYSSPIAEEVPLRQWLDERGVLPETSLPAGVR